MGLRLWSIYIYLKLPWYITAIKLTQVVNHLTREGPTQPLLFSMSQPFFKCAVLLWDLKNNKLSYDQWLYGRAKQKTFCQNPSKNV